MQGTRFILICAIGLALILQACAAAPPASAPPTSVPSEVASPKPAPELTLNLPVQTTATCPCNPASGVDRNYLIKGLNALLAGDHKEAVNYLRRYQRLESTAGANWEASIAIAYDKMLPQSPYYNWRAARESYLRLIKEQPEGIELHEQILLMRDSLAIFSDLHAQINDLQSQNHDLSENLEKREEALRRLRELALGQKGAAQ